MKFTLKPLSHPELGEIVVRDDLFTVSRNEAPFAALSDGTAVGLSASHAKLFRQQDTLHVVDLGSRGGTTVNRRAVHKRAVSLQDGDELCFAGQICFRIEISEPQRPEPGAAPLTLVLVPTPENTPLEPIVIDHFPFLVGKDVGVFSGYKTHFPEESRYISRRHALIFRQQGGLYVEDLGSTNGTFLDGQRLATGARLEDRANIAFGGNFFSYRMELAPVVAEAFSQEPGTIFVTAADSFLDAFCPEIDASADTDEAVAGNPALAKAKQGVGKPRREGLFGRVRIFLAELKLAFTDEQPSRPRRRWLWFLPAGGLLTVALALGFYLKGSPERTIHELMAEQRYADSAAMAERYLEAHPGNERISLLGTESMAKQVIPTWMARLEGGDFKGAEQVLSSAARLSRFNDDARKMLALLEWAGRLERFIAERGGPRAPIVIFHDEVLISELVEWWENDSRGHRNRLTRLMDYVPECRPVGARVASHLAGLQNEKSSYLHAIAQLTQTIRNDLAADRAGELTDVLKTFQSQYPRIGGMQRVWLDLERWQAIQTAIRRQDLDAALRLSRHGQFATPLFREAAQAQIAVKLPPPEIAAEYEKAERAWAKGDWDHAFELLQGLAGQPWSKVAQQRLQRYKKVLQDYRALQQARDSADYGRRLLAFYNRLDPTGDAHMHRALKGDFQTYRAQALLDVQHQFQQASREWSRYQAKGGIDGLLRLEDVVSAAFRRQAGALSRAFEQASHMMRSYALLQKAAPAPAQQLYENLFAEIKRQRQWLEDMRIVMNASLLNAKLALLPGPLEAVDHER